MVEVKTISELYHLYKQERLPSLSSQGNYRSLLNTYQKITANKTIFVDHDTVIKWRDCVLLNASAISFNSYLRQMRALFEVAVEFGFLETNPFRKIKTITCYQQKPKTLEHGTLKTIKTFLEKSNYPNAWFWLIVVNFFYTTAIRRKQLITLTWQDIDFSQGVAKLSAQGSKTKKEYFVPLTHNNVSDLSLIYQRQISIKKVTYDDQVFNVTLFSKRFQSATMQTDNISHFFKKLSKGIGTRVSAHRIRHTVATRLANQDGNNIKTLQNMLGHSNIGTTLGYVHPDVEDIRKIQGSLERL